MSSAAIRAEIERKTIELHEAQEELSKTNRNCEEIEYFKRKIQSEHDSFMGALESRRSNLNKLSNILPTVKIAGAYQRHASEMLSGREYGDAEDRYGAMDSAVRRELRLCIEEIETLENKIQLLKNQISNLEVQYTAALAQEEAERRAREEEQRRQQNGR